MSYLHLPALKPRRRAADAHRAMLILIVSVGWVLVLPALVVTGLSLASKILGVRARRRGTVDVTGFARELAAMRAAEPRAISQQPAVTPREQSVGSSY